jgi:hypothetical protein
MMCGVWCGVLCVCVCVCARGCFAARGLELGALCAVLSVKHAAPPGRGCNCHGVFQLFWLLFFLVDRATYFAYELPPGGGIPSCVPL